ncbi:AAC(3) family N-acetyltransferase [Brevibacillus borstelensis]|uniref:AAC(3) family N-acetyltransferase n=1 Tax=Brevibacillus borstelensis TaxID=45462 RepID=UPI002E208B8B|nr:AAC(3) family N-acetyltransferase [Brevibacillus borstelensis]MED1873006.1 AAC(3) family N-acetyltransferase [Brevibacillus borstelensis]
MTYIPFVNVIEGLGLQKGDVVLVASDLLRLTIEAYRHGEKVDGNLFIDKLQSIIGESGTLLFPTYNWDFCNGTAFDYRNTPSKTGALSNLALKRADFSRTKHPIYSFAVWGKDRDYLCGLNNTSSFGHDSPFAYLHQQKAKMLVIGLDYSRSFTFVHYVEELEKVDYRYLKNFTGPYIDAAGYEEERTYSMYVRDIERGVVNVFLQPLIDRLEQERASSFYEINKVPIYMIDLETAFRVIQDEIRNNGARNLYKLEK